MSIPKHKNSYWLYGLHAVRAALDNPRRKVLRLCVSRNAEEKVEGKVKAEVVDGQFFARTLPQDAVHQGVAAEVQPLPGVDLEDMLADSSAPLLLLDQVTDPHNVGAILRSAAAFGAKAVVVTAHGAAPESAVMAKAACGALEIVPIVTVTNLSQAMEQIKKAGYWVAGLDGEAKITLQQAKLGANTALVLGAEGKGLRRLTGERCDVLARLPISPKMESLNVSNAAAVALYELFRQA